MYAAQHAQTLAQRPVFIMADSGESVSYAQFERGNNRLAHCLRQAGLQRLDHYAIFMENNARYLEACGAGDRAGLYYTCFNSYLLSEELVYILNNSESRVLITSTARLDIARVALQSCPRIEACLVVDCDTAELSQHAAANARIVSYLASVSGLPSSPIEDEFRGARCCIRPALPAD